MVGYKPCLWIQNICKCMMVPQKMRVMYNENIINGAGVIDIGGLLDIDDNGCFYFDGVHNDEPKSSSTSMN